MLRERAGARQLTIELPDGARVRDALAALGDLAAGLPLVMAVNREYAPEDQVLDPGDELALIPPVSGGAGAARGPPRGNGGAPPPPAPAPPPPAARPGGPRALPRPEPGGWP